VTATAYAAGVLPATVLPGTSFADNVSPWSVTTGGKGLPMRVERSANTASLLDVLDRVLDKGIVIDAWVRLSLVGIELVTVEAHVVVASIYTYLGYAGALSELKQPAVTPVQKSSPGP
jgi:hypothetical protein